MSLFDRGFEICIFFDCLPDLKVGGFSMSNNALVNGNLGYPPDPSSLMAAMGSQMPYEVKIPIVVT